MKPRTAVNQRVKIKVQVPDLGGKEGVIVGHGVQLGWRILWVKFGDQDRPVAMAYDEIERNDPAAPKAPVAQPGDEVVPLPTQPNESASADIPQTTSSIFGTTTSAMPEDQAA